MSDRNDILQPEDYLEPRCLLCDEPYGAEPEVRAIPQRRVLEKVDEYMSRRDYDGVERTLKYWLEEARLGHDLRGELLVQNELIGHYRKVGNKDLAFESVDEALTLLKKLDFEDSISAGTTYTNAATACNAFEDNERSIALFEKARAVYENHEQTDPALLGGLYNNMALTYGALKQYDEARALYDKALGAMGEVPNGALEQAITWLNIADLSYLEKGPEDSAEEVEQCLSKAARLLDDPAVPKDGYYAFVCEKCAPAFAWYGYETKADELNERAEQIYERT